MRRPRFLPVCERLYGSALPPDMNMSSVGSRITLIGLNRFAVVP